MEKILNYINGKLELPNNDNWIEKYNPHSGNLMSYIANSDKNDVNNAVNSAVESFDNWSNLTPVERGNILFNYVSNMKKNIVQLSECVSLETGKSYEHARGEVNVAISQGEYWASEGMRLHGRSLTSGMKNKYSYTVRQPVGTVGLIVPANTPIANVAWKIFPALICGNTIILKASEDSPKISVLMAELANESGIPNGVFNVIQGLGDISGAELVKNSKVALISFTGSTKVGKWILENTSKRLARVSLELGGKNPLVVCDDADLDSAVKWASLSAFSNAGQRCASGSRIIIFENVYEKFKLKLIEKAKSLKLGISEGDDLGPVINKKQHTNIINSINEAVKRGGNLLCGGKAPSNKILSKGYYIEPTILDNLKIDDKLNLEEIFGPVVTLNSVKNIEEALYYANYSDYGLTSSIHTRNIDRANWFAQKVKAGVANINLGTYGSEAHMPFGGYGFSGNGTREPGIEALDVYSELKNISVLIREELI